MFQTDFEMHNRDLKLRKISSFILQITQIKPDKNLAGWLGWAAAQDFCVGNLGHSIVLCLQKRSKD